MKVKINGTQIGYDDFGQGPVVLFLQNDNAERQVWDQQVEPLVEAGFRVILADLRDSTETEEAPTIRAHSADMIGLLNYLGIGRAAICGLSTGDSVICDLIENHPQRIAGAYLAPSDVIQSPERQLLVEALQMGTSFKSSKVPTILLAAECNPITHQKQDKKTEKERIVNMEYVHEFNRHLLDFLTKLAPRKTDEEMTPLSTIA